MKSNTRAIVIVIIAITFVVATASLSFAQKDAERIEDFTSFSEAELQILAEGAHGDSSGVGRDKILKNFKRMFSLAAAAQAEGLGRSDKVNREMAFDMDRVFAAEEFRRNPKGTVSKEEVASYSAAHWDDIKLDLKIISPETLMENIEEQKNQWIEMMILAERCRRAGLDKEPRVVSQLKFHRANLLERAYLTMLRNTLKPSPAEIRDYLEMHSEAHMEKFKRKAEATLARIKKGESFAKLARNFSDDTYSKNRNGDLGWVSKEKLLLEIARIVFSLHPGQVSDLIKTDSGFHIVKVEKRRIIQRASTKQAEVKMRNILIDTSEAENIEDKVLEPKVEAAVQSVMLKYPVRIL